VEAIETPWAGERPGGDAGFRGMHDAGMAEVIESATLSLRMITGEHHGFTGNEIHFDWKSRLATASGLVTDADARARVVAAWRAGIPDLDERERIPALVRRLRDRDPAAVLRAMRELHRITGAGTDLPAGVLTPSGDDADARNAVRVWMEGADRDRHVQAWTRHAIPILVERLASAEVVTVVWAMRDLHRLTGDADGFPPGVLERSPRDAAARDAVRAWLGSVAREETLAAWRARR
jgi:hypothetical protein